MSVRTKFILILVLAFLAGIMALPREDKALSIVGIKNTRLQIRQGLDLKGGAHLVYEANMDGIPQTERSARLEGVVSVIQERVNPAGTSEINVQTANNNRVIVEFPGIKNTSEAIELIGKTAQLRFFEFSATGEQINTNIDGKDLKTANADIDPQSGQSIISFELKAEAAKRFADLTSQINQRNSRLLITLDDQPLFNGTVQTPITDGRGQMQGFESIKEAKRIATLLKAGALPVPISLVEQRTVGPTLGQESVEKSLVAGIIGLLSVAIFMLLYYRLAGAVAVAALSIYTVLLISIIKLSALTPYTMVLTLAGIAGFILSIGMAVDANILIFERFREEVRRGRDLVPAMEAGFDRAWTSIKDSNTSSLITTAILYFFSGTPIIKGFAVTLAVGVVVSMFTAIVVSRNLLRMLLKTKMGQNLRLYGLTEMEVGS